MTRILMYVGALLALAARGSLAACSWGECQDIRVCEPFRTSANFLLACPKGFSGYQYCSSGSSRSAVRGCVFATQFVGTGAAVSGNSTTSGSTQTSGNSTTSTTGSGSASSSTSASSAISIHVDASAFSGAWVEALQTFCAGGGDTNKITIALQTYINACYSAATSCKQDAASTGGGTTSSFCKVDSAAFVQASVSAVQAAVELYLQTGTDGACASQSAILTAQIDSSVMASLNSQVYTWIWTGTGGGSASAVAATAVSAQLSTFTQFCSSVVLKTCTCQPTCSYCKQQPSTCTGSTCAGSGTTGSTSSTDNNQTVTQFPYSAAHGTVQEICSSTLLQIKNTCGAAATIDLLTTAFAKAIAAVNGKVFAGVTTSGNATAIAKYSLNSVGQAYTSMLDDFTISAAASLPACDQAVYAQLMQSLKSTGWANFCVNISGLRDSSSGSCQTSASLDFASSFQQYKNGLISDPSTASLLNTWGADINACDGCNNAGVTPGRRLLGISL